MLASRSTNRQTRDIAGRNRCPMQGGERHGAVVVEFALTASLLFLIVFAAIEFMRVNTIVNSTENAAYEGARAGIVPGATAAQATAAAQAMINAIGVRNARIDIQPPVLLRDTPEITVTIDVPLDSNSFVAPKFFLGGTITKACTLAREVPTSLTASGS